MPTTINAAGRTLIDADLFHRLTTRLANDHDLDTEMAGRVIDQTLVFLKACADNPQLRLAPSEDVDLGWHMFLLHTREYAEFCDTIAGRFIHHVPAEPGHVLPPDELSQRIAALEGTGLTVDRMLWHTRGDCKRCGNACHRCNTDPPAAD